MKLLNGYDPTKSWVQCIALLVFALLPILVNANKLPQGLSEQDWIKIRTQIETSALVSDGELVSAEKPEKNSSERSIATNIIQSDYIKASNTDAGDVFGFEIALSGSTLAVGAHGEDSDGAGVEGNPTNNTLTDSGAVYVFEQDEAGWQQVAYLKASNPGSGDQFGRAVDLHGDLMVVGAFREDSSTTGVNSDPNNSAADAGAAYIFRLVDGIWEQEAYLKASNAGAGDWFGESVSIHNDTVIVGARYEDSSTVGVNPTFNNSAQDAGAAYVFVYENGKWIEQAYLKASNTNRFDHFGVDVDIWGNTLVVGSFLEDSGSNVVNGSQGNTCCNESVDYGAVYFYERDNGEWAQQAYIKAPNPDVDDLFGISVSLNDRHMVVGAYLEDSTAQGVGGQPFNNGASNSGAAYVYKRNDNGDWRYIDYLKATNTGMGDEFGRHVEISGNFIVVDARLEDSSSQITDDIPNDDFPDAGAAYLYVIDNDTIRSVSYLKASNAGTNDAFGFPVAISGTSIAVGAHLEDSNSTGVNGVLDNNDATDAGAVYIFNQASSFHPLGGTILGLVEGNSITLRNNEGDDLVLAANGQFRFAPLYTSGETFNITVDSANTNPHQDCTITGADGVVDANSFESLLIDCTLSTLSIADNINTVESAVISVPIQLAPEGLSLSVVSFSIDYDSACLNPDRDADGELDNIVFNTSSEFTPTFDFDPTKTDGEIFISVADFSAPLSALSAGQIATIDFLVDCPAAQPFTISPIQFGSDPVASFGDLAGQPALGTTDDGSARVWDGITGDCNVANGLEGSDIGAVALEIADGDGDDYLAAPSSDFFGSPQGCDANGNELITAADAACINLLMRGDACAPLRSPSAGAKPELNVSVVPEEDVIWLQSRVHHHSESLAGVSYRLELDLNEFDTSLLDLNKDGVVDDERLRFPQGQPGVITARWSKEGSIGFLDVLLLDIAQNELPEGLVFEIGIPTAQIPNGGLSFSQERVTVFASTDGQDVEGVNSLGNEVFQDSFE